VIEPLFVLSQSRTPVRCQGQNRTGVCHRPRDPL